MGESFPWSVGTSIIIIVCCVLSLTFSTPTNYELATESKNYDDNIGFLYIGHELDAYIFFDIIDGKNSRGYVETVDYNAIEHFTNLENGTCKIKMLFPFLKLTYVNISSWEINYAIDDVVYFSKASAFSFSFEGSYLFVRGFFSGLSSYYGGELI